MGSGSGRRFVRGDAQCAGFGQRFVRCGIWCCGVGLRWVRGPHAPTASSSGLAGHWQVLFNLRAASRLTTR